MGVHVGEVERLLPQLRVVGDHLPRLAVVIGAVQPAVARFDQRPHAARPRRRDGDADPAQDATGQPWPAGQLLPRGAAVGGAEDAGVRPSAPDGPGLADHLPERREQHVRPVRVQAEVAGAGRFAAVQHPLPGGAAVGGAEHAALRVAAEGAAQRRHVHRVRVPRMHADAADVARGRQTQVAPRFAAVIATVDAVAVGDVDPDLRFTHAGVHRAVRGRRHGDGAHGSGPEVAVGDVAPEAPRVGGLPDAARAGAEVEHQRVSRIAGDGHHAAAAVRADAAPAHRRQRGCRITHRAVPTPDSTRPATMWRVASITRSTCAAPMCRLTTRRTRVGGRGPASTPSAR